MVKEGDYWDMMFIDFTIAFQLGGQIVSSCPSPVYDRIGRTCPFEFSRVLNETHEKL